MILRLFIFFLLWTVSTIAFGQSIDKLLFDYSNTSDSLLRADIEEKLAWAYQDQEVYSRAVEFYEKALKGRTTDTLRAQKLRAGIAFCYHELGDRDAEIGVREEILQFASHDTSISASTIQTLSILYVEVKNYDKAIEYTERLLQEATAQKDYQLITQAYNNLGYIFHLQNNSKKSSEYFNKSYEVTTMKGSAIKNPDRVKILINLGVVNANLGHLERAQALFAESVEIAKNQSDPLILARALNFKATGYYLRDHINNAITILNESMATLKTVSQTEESDAIRSDCYKLMAELMLKKNDIQSFRSYQRQYDELREQTLQYQKRRYRLLLERQFETEKQEREIQRLISENQNNKVQLIQSELSALQKERELEVKLKELAMLKNENDLQTIRFQNQQLEKEKISQLLEIVQQKGAVAEQEQKIKLLQQGKKLQELTLAKSRKEIELLEKAQQQQSKIKKYSFVIIGLLLTILSFVVAQFFYRNRKNRALARQNQLINDLNREMLTQNEELTSVNDALNERTNEVEKQNQKLTQAQQIIDKQNKKLLSYSRNLEAEIDKRVKEIKSANNELIRYTNQLEQFAFTVSHNLRGPIARLLGLTNLLAITTDVAERNFMLAKVAESSAGLDEIIKDLVKILDIKYNTELMVESIDLDDRVTKALISLEHVTRNGEVAIKVDFSKVSKINSVGTYIDSILYNLISNAIKYKSPDRPCRIEVCSMLLENEIMLTVKDNGVGIDLDKYGHQLFGLYKRFNTHIEGKGLGLYLVKAQVESLNGRIEVESVPDGGAIFRIMLPHVDHRVPQERMADEKLIKLK